MTVKFNPDEMRFHSYAVKIEIYKIKLETQKIELETIDIKLTNRIPSLQNASALFRMNPLAAERLCNLQTVFSLCRLNPHFVNRLRILRRESRLLYFVLTERYTLHTERCEKNCR